MSPPGLEVMDDGEVPELAWDLDVWGGGPVTAGTGATVTEAALPTTPTETEPQ